MGITIIWGLVAYAIVMLWVGLKWSYRKTRVYYHRRKMKKLQQKKAEALKRLKEMRANQNQSS